MSECVLHSIDNCKFCKAAEVHEEKSVCSNDLLSAVQRFHAAWVACQECPKMLLSDGCDDEAKRLMEELHRARDKMFKLAGR